MPLAPAIPAPVSIIDIDVVLAAALLVVRFFVAKLELSAARVLIGIGDDGVPVVARVFGTVEPSNWMEFISATMGRERKSKRTIQDGCVRRVLELDLPQGNGGEDGRGEQRGHCEGRVEMHGAGRWMFGDGDRISAL